MFSVWHISQSKIHGNGLYTNIKLYPDDFIDVAVGSDRIITFFGSKINHSYTPNTYLKKLEDGTYGIFALSMIDEYTELTANYVNTPDFIRKPEKWYK